MVLVAEPHHIERAAVVRVMSLGDFAANPAWQPLKLSGFDGVGHLSVSNQFQSMLLSVAFLRSLSSRLAFVSGKVFAVQCSAVLWIRPVLHGLEGDL